MAFGRDSTDRRFAQFCRSGDPDALGDVFDRTAGRLMRVALWLAGNRADAEDLLQRTFLQAIETRQQFRAGERVLPWLMGLLGNQARKQRRERDRTAALRTQADRVADPEVDAAASELDAAVRAVRERLGEPYREVLALHLEQGLNAKEIAERLARPSGTVRTQLMRALELLRKKLPGGFVAGLTAIALVDASAMAAVRAAVIATARSAAPMVVTGTGSAVTTIGGLLMAKKALVAVPLLLLLSGLATWEALRPGERVPPRPAVEAATGGAAAVAKPRTDSRADAAQPLERKVVTDAATDVEPGFAVLRVVAHWQQDGNAAPGVGVSVIPKGIASELLERYAVTGGDGVAVLRHIVPGAYYVDGTYLVDTDDVVVAAGQLLTITVVAAPTSTAQGRVLDVDGNPVADARIWLSCSGTWRVGWDVGHSNADGTFTVPLRGHQYIGARKEGHVPSYMRAVAANDGPFRDLVLDLRGAAARVHGVVSDSRGAPVPWATVLVGPPGGGTVPNGTQVSQRTEPNPQRLTTDASGAFTANEAPPRTGNNWAGTLQIWAPSFGPLASGYTAEAGKTTELALVLEDAAIVAGVVRDGAGAPVAQASIHFGDEFGNFPQVLTRADDEGRFCLGDLPARAGVLVSAGKNESGAKARLDLRAGETTEWNPVLGNGRTIAGTVVGPDERPMAGLKIGAVHPSFQHPRQWHDTDAAGHFELTHVGDEPRVLRVAKGEVVLTEIAAVAPDSKDVVIRLAASDMPTARLRGRVVDAEGRAAIGYIWLRRDGGTVTANLPLDAATGSFTFGPAPAALFAISVITKETGVVHMGTVQLVADQERTLDDLVLQRPGGVELIVTEAAGQNVASANVWLHAQSGEALCSSVIERGLGKFASLQPGRYFVDINFDTPHDVESMTAEFEVKSGAVTRVEVRGVRAVPTRLHFRDQGPANKDLSVTGCCRSADGHIIGFFQTFPVNSEPLTTWHDLPPGHHRLDCRASDGRQFVADIEVRADAVGTRSARQEFSIDLPAK
jgi:RNA polymerase sigma-70 factor (ECF subfamily)